MIGQDSTTEERTTAANYILSFYNEIAYLNHTYSNYKNMLLELQFKSSSETENLNQLQKDTLIQNAQTVRYYCTKVYIQFKAMQTNIDNLGKEKEKELAEHYKQIESNFIIKVDDLTKFVVLMNSILINKVMKGLLVSSQEIIQDIYKDE